MALKIIGYKKVDLTDDEFETYQQIKESYTRDNFNGEELFVDLFETDDTGNITFIKATGNKQTSMEVLFFVMNLMLNQWLRASAKRINYFIKYSETKQRSQLKILDDKIKKADMLIEKLEQKLASN